MMKRIVISLIAATPLMVNQAAMARSYGSSVFEAPVISTTAVYDQVRVSEPRENCWTETVQKNTGRDSKTPEIVGALLGAAVGYQFGGSKRAHRAAAGAGAILGTSIGNDWDAKRKQSQPESVTRCETVDSYRTEERLAGYDVRYEHNGQIYNTFSKTHPGDSIRVRVSITPVE